MLQGSVGKVLEFSMLENSLNDKSKMVDEVVTVEVLFHPCPISTAGGPKGRYGQREIPLPGPYPHSASG